MRPHPAAGQISAWAPHGRVPGWLLLGAFIVPAACAPLGPTVQPNAPPFAVMPYEAFSRENVVAIALREWRLWGQRVDDDPPGSRPPALPDGKPERQAGLWQRIGEYWWMGAPRGSAESGWTGRHDDTGRVFPASQDGSFAWSAAFVSYVMRIAGAGAGFPYSADHAGYINAAIEADRSGRVRWVVHTQGLTDYSPLPGDLVCMGRGEAAGLRLNDLPAGHFPGHCDIVVDVDLPEMVTVVGGNIGDAVTMKHIPVTADGRLASPEGIVLDTRYPWLLVLQVQPVASRPLS